MRPQRRLSKKARKIKGGGPFFGPAALIGRSKDQSCVQGSSEVGLRRSGGGPDLATLAEL